MLQSLIDIKNISVVQSNKIILYEVNFETFAGDFVYLIGKVGSGKTSLVKTLYAELPLYIGSAKIDGFNLVQNNFPAAGQVIPHLHFHIIPRMKGDGPLRMVPGKIQAKDEDLRKIVQKIKE